MPSPVYIKAASVDHLQKALANAFASATPVAAVDVSSLDRVLSHSAEDMTATAQAGIPLAAFQEHLAAHNQWLPIDPPFPERTSIGEVLANNLSGPRRLGYGTVRDHLIGIRVALANGELAYSGGNVVKNVAGFDLGKLFIGSQGTLGIVTEATFKLLPKPEAMAILSARFPSLEEARGLIDAIFDSALTPTLLDCHNLLLPPGHLCVTVGFEGSTEGVEYQKEQLSPLGSFQTGTLEYWPHFWEKNPNPHRWSGLSSSVFDWLTEVQEGPFVAHAGTGTVWYQHGPEPPEQRLPSELIQRLKSAFDEKGILPSLINVTA